MSSVVQRPHIESPLYIRAAKRAATPATTAAPGLLALAAAVNPGAELTGIVDVGRPLNDDGDTGATMLLAGGACGS